MNEQGAHIIIALRRSKLNVDKITAAKFLSHRPCIYMFVCVYVTAHFPSYS